MPLENCVVKTSWSLTGSHHLSKICWLGLKSHNQRQEQTGDALDPSPVNTAKGYPNQGESLTSTTTQPTILLLKAPVKAITSYIAWNVRVAISNM